jgi:hypothetical protein
MAIIKNAYDLAGGNAETDEVTSPDNWRVTYTTAGMPAGQGIDLHFMVAGENNAYGPLRDRNRRPVIETVSDNKTDSLNFGGVNAAKGKIEIKVPESATGTITIDSINK